MIKNEDDPEKKAQLQSLLDEHKRDAELVRDFNYHSTMRSMFHHPCYRVIGVSKNLIEGLH